jgi:hypothetical protein
VVRRRVLRGFSVIRGDVGGYRWRINRPTLANLSSPLTFTRKSKEAIGPGMAQSRGFEVGGNSSSCLTFVSLSILDFFIFCLVYPQLSKCRRLRRQLM